jgi:hypothetical protein
MDDVLIEFAGEHVDLNCGIFFCKMIGRATAPSTKPFLQLWIPSDFVSHAVFTIFSFVSGSRAVISANSEDEYRTQVLSAGLDPAWAFS